MHSNIRNMEANKKKRLTSLLNIEYAYAVTSRLWYVDSSERESVGVFLSARMIRSRSRSSCQTCIILYVCSRCSVCLLCVCSRCSVCLQFQTEHRPSCQKNMVCINQGSLDHLLNVIGKANCCPCKAYVVKQWMHDEETRPVGMVARGGASLIQYVMSMRYEAKACQGIQYRAIPWRNLPAS